MLGKVYERLSPGLPEGATMPDVGLLLQLVVQLGADPASPPDPPGATSQDG